jgi:hypothetical protein
MALTILTGSSQAAAFNYSYTTSGSADWASVPTASYFYDIVDKTIRFKSSNSTFSNVATASFALTASNVSGTVTSASYASTASYVSNAMSASYATTASYALNGGVTQLLAGPNVTLSPTNGLGQVTVSATLSGSTVFNTSTGSYGSFYDTTTQTNPVANIPRSMSLNTTDITNGVSISGSTSPFNTYIKTQNAGVYNIQFSAQLDKTDSGVDEVVIWLRKNGTDLTDTATTITLTNNNTKQVAAWNWFVNSAANDYYQIIWRSLDTDLRLFAEPLNSHPGIPSVIVTANRVDQFLSNTGSFSGSFNGVFTGSLQGTASFAQTASYVLNAESSSFATTASYADIALSASYAPGTTFPFTGSALITGSLGVTGSLSIDSPGPGTIDFGDGSQIQSIPTSSGDGYGYTTLTLTPDTSIVSDQYIVLDPTTPNHIHIRAGGTIDSSSAYLYLGGEKSNIVVRNLNDSFAEKHWVQINAQTGSTQSTWVFNDDGDLTVPGSVLGVTRLQHINSNAIGTGSHAEGATTLASGSYSHAEGVNTIAQGDYSHAEGNGTQAIGNSSHVEGNSTQAIGPNSHAEGVNTIAQGDYSHAEGVSTQAVGQGSHAEGNSTQAVGLYSHAEGTSTQAQGDYSHTEGNTTFAGSNQGYLSNTVVNGVCALDTSYGDVSTEYNPGDIILLDDTAYDNIYSVIVFIVDTSSWDGTNSIITLTNLTVNTTTAIIGNITYGVANWAGGYLIGGYYSHAEGNGTYAMGQWSHAEGVSTQAVGPYSHAEGEAVKSIGGASHAEGYSTNASGQYSHAEGYNTQAIGGASHAEGYYTLASGSFSHAEGDTTQAIGEFSHAEGVSTQAIGLGSHAEGVLTEASGSWSHAEGRSTIASGSYQHVSGQYNTHGDTTSLFIVGNGVDDNTRSDAFKVTPSGSIILPTVQSSTPPWTGTQGEMVFSDNGTLYKMNVWLNGGWRSTSLV